MRKLGSNAAMTARNRIRAMLEETGGVPDERICAWVRWLTCGEGQGVDELFPKEEAERIIAQCNLVCPLQPEEGPPITV